MSTKGAPVFALCLPGRRLAPFPQSDTSLPRGSVKVSYYLGAGKIKKCQQSSMGKSLKTAQVVQ